MAEPRPGPLPRRDRWLLGLAGTALLAVFTIAACLHPDPRGWGTHTQLGLPPCTSVVLFGLRCPACGMTTSWAALFHGRPLDALQIHAGGTLLALLAMVAAVWSLGSAVHGRVLWRMKESTMLTAAAIVVSISIVQWLGRVLSE